MRKPCIFFDLDGTYVRWQWFHAWIVALVEADIVHASVLEQSSEPLVAYRKRQGRFEDFAEAIVQAFFQQSSLKSVRVSDVERLSCEFAVENSDYVHVFTRELSMAASECGYERAIITGSPTIAVRPFAEKHGIHIVIGTDIPHDGERFTGGEITEWLFRKDEAVKIIAEEHNINLDKSIAVGDSATDAKMMQMVRHPIAFQPNTELFLIAKQHLWPIVFEKKMILPFIWVSDVQMRFHLTLQPLHNVLPAKLSRAVQTRLEACDVYVEI